MTERSDSKESRFNDLLARYQQVIAKVCYIYTDEYTGFDDLYQETLINLWQGLDSFRGESKISTWIYRTTLNSCITWLRRNKRYNKGKSPLDEPVLNIADTEDDSVRYLEEYRTLHNMIARLNDLDKALITLWLDEKPYDEIALITGLSQNNVAVRLHRIKERLTRMASND